jgi:hypothetical protein
MSDKHYAVDTFAFAALLDTEETTFLTTLRGGYRAPDVMQLDEEACFVRAYCMAHPTDRLSDAMQALNDHAAGIAAAIAAHLRPPPAKIADVSASSDECEYVVTMAPKWAPGRIKDNPDKDERTGIALGRAPLARFCSFPTYEHVRDHDQRSRLSDDEYAH